MACQYLRMGGFFEDSICEVTKRKINSSTVSDLCNTFMKHAECEDYKKATGWWHITTATCKSMGKPIDCHEVVTMCSFRDKWLAKQPNGQQAIAEYSTVAPRIVEAIDKREDAYEIYKSIYENTVLPCMTHIENGSNEECFALYMKMVAKLREKFNLG